ncbi:hypothetical protein [Mycolicibacter sinensis]|uniref:Gp37-like protein n=1 Tax=Mycolicibacter sinensis (strain JDM601) TaxID=875328 RepID=UPI0007EA599C|nr:hypothetical protein [Mycolicibacter sinensis]OBH20799.1 hypothetical protein A5694_15590 [Mycolicibacter sinensis]
MAFKFPPIGQNGVPDPLRAPISAYRYAHAKRLVKDAESRARPLIRLWDKDMNFIGRIGGEKSVDVEQRLHDTGTGSIVLRGSDWINKFLRTDVRANDDLNITIDPYPNNRNWRWRWGGKVTAVRNVRTEQGLHELHFDVAENREHWKHLYFAATPWFAPEIQPLKAWVLPGNTRTIVSVTGFVNLARIFWPPLGIIDNFVNPGAWLRPLSDASLWSPLNWPIQMQFVNPFTDTSRFSVIATRWSPAHDTTAGMLKDAGCNVRAYTWLPEDEDSPHPELADLIGQEAARPGRACIVLAVEDNSGVVGLTGTAVDGAINLVAATADDLISELLYEFADADAIDPRTNSPVPPYIRDLLGIAPIKPSIVFRDSTPTSPIKTSERAVFKSKAKSILVGGKSPGWVNQLQTFGIKLGLSQFQITNVDGYGHSTGPAPQGSGLEEVYQGQFDNMLLAFMRYTDPLREISSGNFGYLEYFTQEGGGTAYTISSALTIRQGHWKTRPYQAFKVSIWNRRPYSVYYDFDLGTRALFEIDGLLYTDQFNAIRMHYDEDTPKTFEVTIGTDSEQEDPLGQAVRTLQTMWSAVGTLFGSNDLY